ncbi:MAG: IS1595 family transposase [Bacteroidota bacterium]
MIDTNFIVLILRNENQHDLLAIGGNLLCPFCKVRTKLYKLSDRRRKCKRYGKKFGKKVLAKQSHLQIVADTVMGFCLDWSALRTARLFRHRYRSILSIYYLIRETLVKVSNSEQKLQGTVECDESYFGGTNHKRNKKYRKRYVGRGRGTDKTPVFGIKQRAGRVVIELLGDFSNTQIEAIIQKKVTEKSNVMTDEFSSYKGLVHKGYIHRFVEHGKEQYVQGNVHVNGMENFWGWAKEQMFKYHGVFKQNLIYYLKEMEWKFNHRTMRPEEKAIEIATLIKDILSLQSEETFFRVFSDAEKETRYFDQYSTSI